MRKQHAAHLTRRVRRRVLLSALVAAPLLVTGSASLVHADAATATCGQTYVVQRGDTLGGISLACGVPLATIHRLNVLGAFLQPGQVIYLAPSTSSNGLSSPTFRATPASPSVNGLNTYVVQRGDTLSAIALRLGLSESSLAAANGLTSLNVVRLGQTLRWTTPAVQSAFPAAMRAAVVRTSAATTLVQSTATGRTYRVRPGDTLSGIAFQTGVSAAALQRYNNIFNANHVSVGALLRVPSTGTIAVAGFRAASPTTAVVAPAAVVPRALRAVAPTSAGLGYTVRSGDTISGIALRLGLTSNSLAAANGLSLTRPIHVGQVLRYSNVAVSTTGPASSSPSVTASGLSTAPAATVGLPGALESTASRAEIGAVLDAQAAQVGIEDSFLKAIAFKESTWRMVTAYDGGIGVMQLMPDTVTWLKNSYVPGAWDPYALTDNVHAGAVLLQAYSTMYGGDLARVATAYHGGMGAVSQTRTAEMQGYINTVLYFRNIFLAGSFPG